MSSTKIKMSLGMDGFAALERVVEKSDLRRLDGPQALLNYFGSVKPIDDSEKMTFTVTSMTLGRDFYYSLQMQTPQTRYMKSVHWDDIQNARATRISIRVSPESTYEP